MEAVAPWLEGQDRNLPGQFCHQEGLGCIRHPETTHRSIQTCLVWGNLQHSTLVFPTNTSELPSRAAGPGSYLCSAATSCRPGQGPRRRPSGGGRPRAAARPTWGAGRRGSIHPDGWMEGWMLTAPGALAWSSRGAAASTAQGRAAAGWGLTPISCVPLRGHHGGCWGCRGGCRAVWAQPACRHLNGKARGERRSPVSSQSFYLLPNPLEGSSGEGFFFFLCFLSVLAIHFSGVTWGEVGEPPLPVEAEVGTLLYPEVPCFPSKIPACTGEIHHPL